ncbi:hypothetical protein A5682_13245 [Mycobacterium mantenii]|uniref:ester cyclase n=1 Tax=Mycobacterium mantenii TaxID=560555 RepID=UPI000801129E|nr:ester cyclase [Mycobacterium mantenii]OBH67185.1 hypothetical protein A5682_13245 [Mycobacterium mantenii]
MTETTEAAERQLRETTVLTHFEAENQHDIAATLATFKSGAARTELPGEVAAGHDAVADAYRELFIAFPDMRFDIKPGSLCHHDDRVMVETRVLGTHLGPYRGLPPTGRSVELPLVAIFQFEGADLVCERAYFDRIGLLIQLGVGRDPNSAAGRLATLLNHPITVARAALRSRRVQNPWSNKT